MLKLFVPSGTNGQDNALNPIAFEELIVVPLWINIAEDYWRMQFSPYY